MLGRPSLKDSNADKFAAVKAALAEKKGIRRIARELQTGAAQSARRDGAAAPPHSQTRWPATLWHSGGLIWLHVWSVSQALSATQNDVPAGQEFGAHRCRPVS